MDVLHLQYLCFNEATHYEVCGCVCATDLFLYIVAVNI